MSGKRGPSESSLRPISGLRSLQVDVIGNQHQRALPIRKIDAAGGIGEHHAVRAQPVQYADAVGDLRRRVALVKMSAPGHHCDIQLPQFAKHQLSGMPGGGRYRPAGNLGIRNRNRIGEFVGEGSQSAAEHHREMRFAPGNVPDVCHRFVHYNNMPAMQADMKFAMVPAATAFNPMRARSDLRLGASAPMPPIWIAMELRLANPHSA